MSLSFIKGTKVCPWQKRKQILRGIFYHTPGPFSECEPYQPLLFLVKGVNEAAKDVRNFASDRSKQLGFLSQWDVMENKAESVLSECRDSGKNWLLMESFHLTSNKAALLKHHALLDQEFHPNYRLWLISQTTQDFPLVVIKKSIKLTWEQVGSLAQNFPF